MKADSAEAEERSCPAPVQTLDPELLLQSWIRFEIHRLLLPASTPTLEAALACVIKLVAEGAVEGG